MNRDLQMLNIAAAEHKLQRAAIADCVAVLNEIKSQDLCSVTGKSMRWQQHKPFAIALANAEQLLKPKRPETKG